MSIRRFLAIAFRLSIVAAVVAATFDAYHVDRRYIEAYLADVRLREALECGAKLPYEQLNQHTNDFGLFNLGAVGCAGRTFWASQAELEQSRAGKLDLGYTPPSYDLVSNLASAVVTFISVNLAALLMVGIFIVGRWIWFGERERTSRRDWEP